MGKDEEARLNAKYGAFVVTSYQKAFGRHAPIGKKTYPTIAQATAAATRLEKGNRYAGQMLFVDLAAA